MFDCRNGLRRFVVGEAFLPGGGRPTTSDCHEIRISDPESSAVPAERDRLLTGTAGRPSRGRQTYPRNHAGAEQCCGRGGARLLALYSIM